MNHGLQLAVKKINDDGGLLGKKLELIVIDDAFSESKVVSLYEQLATVNKVDFFFGPFGSGLSVPAAAVADKYGIPFFGTLATVKILVTQGYRYIAIPAAWSKYNERRPCYVFEFLGGF